MPVPVSRPGSLRGWLSCLGLCVVPFVWGMTSGTAWGMEGALDRFEHFSSAHFVQEQHVAALSRPMVSRGTLRLLADGFEWVQEMPVPVTLRLSGGRLTRSLSPLPETDFRAVGDPVLLRISSLLHSLIRGDETELLEWFEIRDEPAAPERVPDGPVEEAAPGRDTTSVRLVPRPEGPAAFLESIRLEGIRYVDRIVIEQGQGERTLILLDGHTPVAP